MHASLEDWMAAEAIPAALDCESGFNAAVDRLVASLGTHVELLGFGEALHGGEQILQLRNQIFQRLVQAHGYSAIAIESGLPRSVALNAYVAGEAGESFDAVREAGFDHGSGALDANRELVEWIKAYNAEQPAQAKVRFYGFDIPTGTTNCASPRQAIQFTLDFLAAHEAPQRQPHWAEQSEKISELIGDDAAWENPAAFTDPSLSPAHQPPANTLRLEIETLLVVLRTRRAEWVATGGEDGFAQALQMAIVARELLNFHASIAAAAGADVALGIRDALAADNLAYIVNRERRRGKVFAFAHNAHLQRSKVFFPWYSFWPAGSHIDAALGDRYAVIGSALGTSAANGIGQPEVGTLEAHLLAAMAHVGVEMSFIPTHRGRALPADQLASLATRSGSNKNFSYIPLNAQSLRDFDWLAVVRETGYQRGGPPLPEVGAAADS